MRGTGEVGSANHTELGQRCILGVVEGDWGACEGDKLEGSVGGISWG